MIESGLIITHRHHDKKMHQSLAIRRGANCTGQVDPTEKGMHVEISNLKEES